MFHLAILVSKSDLHLLPDSVASLRFCGGLERHRAIFFPTKEVAHLISAEVESLRPHMDMVSVSPLKDTPDGDWPVACNKHFAAVVPVMAGCGTPYMIWEADMTAIKTWADAVATEYNIAGKPFLGMNVPTRYTEGSPQHFGPDHMVGAGMYPKGFGMGGNAPYGHLWKTAPHQNVPYDIYQSGEIRKHLHNSKYMQHMWGTVDFRRNAAGEIICSPKEGNPPGTDHSGAIKDGIAIVHGCKDGSLARLIVGEGKVEKAEVQRNPQEQIVLGGPIAQQQNIYSFKRVPGDPNYHMEGSWDAMAAKPLAPEATPSIETAAEEAVDQTTAPEKIEEVSEVGSKYPSAEFITTRLKEKSMKAKDLTTALGIADQKDFEKHLLSQGFTFAGMAKWVKPPQLQEA